MKTDFDQLNFSIKLRDIVMQIVKDTLEQLRPRYRYATVQEIRPLDPDSKVPVEKASVIFNGETNAVLVNLTGVVPTTVGQIVRVEGVGIDRYITGIVGGETDNGIRFGTVNSLTGGKPNVIWENDTSVSGPYSLTGASSALAVNDKVVGLPVPGHNLLIIKVTVN